MTYTEEKICDLESGYFGNKEFYDLVTNSKTNKTNRREQIVNSHTNNYTND